MAKKSVTVSCITKGAFYSLGEVSDLLRLGKHEVMEITRSLKLDTFLLLRKYTVFSKDQLRQIGEVKHV